MDPSVKKTLSLEDLNLDQLLRHEDAFRPLRTTLYTPAELMEGYVPTRSPSSLDDRIFDHALHFGHLQGRRPSLREALAQRVHDFAIDVALGNYLDFGPDGLARAHRVVGIMGGHVEHRGSPVYRKVARLGRSLTLAGYHVVTGGGPGVMEAGNLGAYLADLSPAELEAAVDVLAAATEFSRTDLRTNARYVQASQSVLARHPVGRGSLAIPTWFYGHEPTNLFATAIAKYFSNSLREDGLLAIGSFGVVFATGSAATRQEIFLNAAQNHYAEFGWCSPMVFLGVEEFSTRDPVLPLLRATANANYRDLLCACDDPEAAVDFIKAHPPRRPIEPAA